MGQVLRPQKPWAYKMQCNTKAWHGKGVAKPGERATKWCKTKPEARQVKGPRMFFLLVKLGDAMTNQHQHQHQQQSAGKAGKGMKQV